jgi:hypothetical protein
MGNNETKIGEEFAKSLQGYTKVRDIQDYRFGNAQLWENKGRVEEYKPKHLIVKEKWSMSK